ncbi:MFS transporter [Nocardia sp. NPDC051750]|uniref:MFS transporter n=1 Tax=Nocardia sp. NPDC051750 TaxID=3364325 RepID=UPI0037BA2AFA
MKLHHNNRTQRDRLSASYYALLGARFVSVVGDGMTQVVLPLLVYASTDSVASVGIVQAARWLPAMAISVIGGALADSYSRRALLILTDLVAGVSISLFVCALSLQPSSDVATIWFCAVAAVLGACAALRNPALGGLLTEIVSPTQLQRAVSLAATSRSVAGLAGPILGGVSLTVVGATATLAIDAVTFFVGTLLLGALVSGGTVDIAGSNLMVATREGWRYVTRRQWMWATTAYSALFQLVYLPTFFVLGPVWVIESGRSAGYWGTLMAVFGAGGIIGSWLPGKLRAPPPLCLVWVTMTAAPVATVTLALDSSSIGPPLAFFLSGIALAISNTAWTAILMMKTPKNLVSRVLAIDGFGSMLLKPLGQVLVGLLGGLFRVNTLMVNAAMIVCVIGLSGVVFVNRIAADESE